MDKNNDLNRIKISQAQIIEILIPKLLQLISLLHSKKLTRVPLIPYKVRNLLGKFFGCK